MTTQEIKDTIKAYKLYIGVHPDSEIREVLEASIAELEAKLLSNSAEYVKEVTVKDPDSKAPVEMTVFKHTDSGAMFAIDSSYLEQCFDDDTDPVIPDPFNPEQYVTLYNL